MGFISTKLFPACGNMCVCCPALRPSSRRPVKRYKKLLSEIFPKSIINLQWLEYGLAFLVGSIPFFLTVTIAFFIRHQATYMDGPPNERKIMKLCEYAAKNPVRIPKIAKFLEQRSYKELRSVHINFIKIITEVYSKLLYICKEQMAYFASSMLNVVIELLASKHQDIQILGCQTLTKFIHSQADSTYARNIESLVGKICMLAHQPHGGQKKRLCAASLECLSAMVWFMAEYSHMFANFDEIIHAVLENYGLEDHVGVDGGSHHHWVDEVVRHEGRGGTNVLNDIGQSNIAQRLRAEFKDCSTLTREESESPEVWAQICIQKLADLARESTTMRRVLDPMLIYFDTGKHWAPQHGLAWLVLSDMAYFVQSSGNEQLILAAVIRHLDHKNVVHDPQLKSDIVQIAASLAQQLRPRAVVVEIGVASDLCRHLRKSLQATFGSVGPQEAHSNILLQNCIEDCLLEIVRGIGDASPLFDLMTITLEKLPSMAVVARATIESLLILGHIISLSSISSKTQLVFPEALLLQLLKAMMHPDVETRIGAHEIFSVVLIRTPNYPRYESDYLCEVRKWQSKTMSVFASATALLERLRRDKGYLNGEKLGNDACDDRNMGEEERKHWVRKASPVIYKLSSSIIDRTGSSASSTEPETNIAILTEDQTSELLSAFWIQANQSDNLPSNFEAISRSFSLTLVSSRLKVCARLLELGTNFQVADILPWNPTNCNTIRFFQLSLSLRNASLDPDGPLPPSCRRSLFTAAFGLLAFTGKMHHISDFTESLKILLPFIDDPYLILGDDFQVYIRPQSDLKGYGSKTDQEVAMSSLSSLRKAVYETDQHMLGILVQALSHLIDMEVQDLTMQLSDTFKPEDGLLLGPKPVIDWENIQALAISEESFSFDENCSRSSSIDADLITESPATDIPRSISKMPTPPMLPHVISVGQLLESALQVAGQVAGTAVSTSPLPYGTMTSQCEALGMCTRRKLSSWLSNGPELITHEPQPALDSGKQADFGKEGHVLPEPWRGLILPPASPFDNFLKAARC